MKRKNLFCWMLFINLICPFFPMQTTDREYHVGKDQSISSSYPKNSNNNLPTNLTALHIINFTSNYSCKMARLSLKGIINEDGPKLFGINDEKDRFWCEYLLNRLEPQEVHYYNNFSSLITTFKSNISGLIVYDPDNLHTRNIGIPLCGIENAILADPQLAEYLHNHFSIPILDDLNLAQKWKENTEYLEMYKWLYDNYLKQNKLNEQTLALQGPQRADLIDLLVAENIFTLWDINTLESDKAELDFISKVFNFYPQNSPILGYPYATGANEGNTVRLISEAGLYLVASDFSSNLGFCNHLEFGVETYSQDRTWENNPPQLENKLYISFLVSDGDNLQFMENQMLEIWKQKNRTSEIPVGWSISPLALKYAPHLVDFYYSNATNSDYFVAGPSGAGYVYPDVMNTDAYEEFLKLTDTYMDELDLSEIWALGLSKPDIISNTVRGTDSEALFVGYSEMVWDTIRLTDNNVPLFTMFKCGIESSELTSCLGDILKWNSLEQPLFLPVWIHCWSQDFRFIEEVVEYSSTENLNIEFVRPDQFVYLYSCSLSQMRMDFYSLGLHVAIFTFLGLASYFLWKKNDKGGINR
ncbi:MAG: GxGYxYP family putative glycoside hydrolase [Promethearchaeia archaeon]